MSEHYRIHFYIGIDPADRGEFFELFHLFNNELEYQMEIFDEYDDPYGYYTFVISGDWFAYDKFLNRNGQVIKSVNHYEE